MNFLCSWQWTLCMVHAYIMAYRPVAKQWFCKQRPLLDNACNMYARNNSYCWKRGVFYVVRVVAVSEQQVAKHVLGARERNVTVK
jgi:hypothetical protein